MSVPADQMQAGLATAVASGVTKANGAGEVPQTELDEVKKLLEDYLEARGFDEYARKQYNADRKYAQGIADRTWASDANIIGAFIDILVSYLYAQNPDVSVRPAPQAGGNSDPNDQLFSETLQIVVSRMWKNAKLKKAMRRVVRSVLSVGVGWVKVLMYSETKRNPQIEKQLGDARDNIAEIESIKKQLAEEGTATDEYDLKITELKNLQTGLQAQVEVLVKKGMCIDFCRAEDMQVSLDVADTEEYLSADWISNDMYVRKSDAAARFPLLDNEDLKGATVYYQRPTGAGTTADQTSYGAETSPDGQFTKESGGPIQKSGGKPIEFVKIIELWDHRDDLIKTIVDGVKKWAVAPYPPPQASNRFYPYFRLSFYETDGARHPQSLSWRLHKLQDEYSGTRSAGVLTRRRSIPGTVFNRGQLSQEDARKLENSEHLEMVGVDLTDPTMKLDQVITSKPIPRVDPALFDTQPCQRDMEVMSGVQEAQQQSVTSRKTATEAEIQQSGFQSRTGTDRDNEEVLLTELAQYTAELAIQTVTVDDAKRYAGPMAFWPFGMNVQDVLTMLDVEIQAGTTGKPQARADKETWATLLPMVQQMIEKIQAQDLSNPAAAKANRSLLRETLRRLDDRLNIDAIIPPAPPPGTPPPPPPPIVPNVNVSLKGDLAPQTAAALVGPALAEDQLAAAPRQPPGAPPVGNGTVNNPAAQGAPQPPK